MFLCTVKVPERVRFWHENVQLSINHSFLKESWAVIGWEVYIFMPKSYTFANFDGICDKNVLHIEFNESSWTEFLVSPISNSTFKSGNAVSGRLGQTSISSTWKGITHRMMRTDRQEPFL